MTPRQRFRILHAGYRLADHPRAIRKAAILAGWTPPAATHHEPWARWHPLRTQQPRRMPLHLESPESLGMEFHFFFMRVASGVRRFARLP